jgi:hypothetical protein
MFSGLVADIFNLIGFASFILVLYVVLRAFLPRTTIEAMNHFLTSDEENFLEREARVISKEGAAIEDIVITGDWLRLHYTSRSDGNAHEETTSIAAISTGAYFSISLINSVAVLIEFQDNAIGPTEKYPSKKRGIIVFPNRIYEFIARRTIIMGRRIAARERSKHPEARLV